MNLFNTFGVEIFFTFLILSQLMFNTFIINRESNFIIPNTEIFFQTFFILICILLVISNYKIENFANELYFIADISTNNFKLLTILVSILILPLISQSFLLQSLNSHEYYTLYLLSILSLFLLICSIDLLSVYLVIEMQALCFYVLATFKRDSSFTTEAGLKYFIAGSFISGIFLIGICLIYGSLGTLNLQELNTLLSFSVYGYNGYLKQVITIGLVLITVTFLFKLVCAPFHFWAPDVYDGAPLSSTIIFSILPKLSLFYFLFKWIITLNIFFWDLKYIFIFSGTYSLILGTFFSLNQTRVKKLLIYSSLAQMGFMVVCLSLNNIESFMTIFFFLIIYLLTSIIIWGVIVLLYSSQYYTLKFFSVEKFNALYISTLSNFKKVSIPLTFILIIVIFSSAGIPPAPGFFSKALILLTLIKDSQLLTSITFIIISSISAYYYIKLIKVVTFEPQKINKNFNFLTIFNKDCINSIFSSIGICLISLILITRYPFDLYFLSEYLFASAFLII